jgi:predicted nucleic acid-binding protein
MPGSFLDSNIVLYLASENLAKADRAQELVAAGGTISVQVLNEIANVSRRKMGLSWAETRNFLSMIRGLLEVKPVTIDIHNVGISLAERYQLSVYDSMIISAALSAECPIRCAVACSWQALPTRIDNRQVDVTQASYGSVSNALSKRHRVEWVRYAPS